MKQATIAEAKEQLDTLVEAALGGEEVVIARHGTPILRLVPVSPPDRPQERRLGQWEGKVGPLPRIDGPDPEIEKLFGLD